MSNEWKMVRLGDICEYIRNGANIKQSDIAGGTPITRIETLSNDKFNRDKLGYADITDDKYSKYYLNNHDILMSHINSEKYLGRAVLYTKESEDETIIHGMNLLSLRTLNDKVIAPFLAYYFATISFKSQIAKISKKSVNQASFSVSCLNKVNIPLPSIKRQQEIAEVLDKASELVEKRKAQLAELDRLAESIFYDMFGDPVTNEKGWEILRVQDVCVSVNYGTSSPAVDNGKYIYLRMNNITYSGELELLNVKYIDIEEKDYEKYIVKKGDILFNRTNSKDLVGKTTYIRGDDEMIIAGYIIRVRVNSSILPVFFSKYMNTAYVKLYLRNLCKNIIGQANINAKELQSIPIYLPPLPLQQQFAERIEKIEEQKAKVKTALKESENLFQRLMQDMFNPEYHNS